MLYTRCSVIIAVSACLQNVIKTNQIRSDISIRICDAVSNTCLRGKIYNYCRFILFKDLVDRILI